MKKPILLFLFLLFLLVLFLIVWGFQENQALEANEISITCSGLPDAFQGFCIAHVSDLHNAQLGTDNENLLNMLRNAAPDLIAITGDLIDSRNTNVEIALAFVEEATKIAPCYYVTGNHESRISEYEQLENGLNELGVIVLHNEAITFLRDGQSIRLAGADDPTFSSSSDFMQALTQLTSDDFTVLLSHRPEFFESYCQLGFDLVLSGHAHGGQFRIPFLGGLIAPHQGLFPKYDSGLYTQDRTHMIVSRGLGNSLFPFRLNNPPEVIFITLNHP